MFKNVAINSLNFSWNVKMCIIVNNKLYNKIKLMSQVNIIFQLPKLVKQKQV